MQRERDGPLRDGIEELRRQEQPVDDRGGEREVRQPAADPDDVPRQALVLVPEPRAHGIDRISARDPEHDRDDREEQGPAQQARARVEPGPHGTSHATVDGEAMTSPSARSSTTAQAPGALEQVRCGVGAGDDGRLREAFSRRRVLSHDRRLDDVGHRRPAGPRVDEVVLNAVRPLPAMDARPGRGDAHDRGGPTIADAESRKLGSLVGGVSHRDLPVRPRGDVERDVAVGVDHRRRHVGQQRPGAIGDPALGHAVEVEMHARATARRTGSARRHRTSTRFGGCASTGGHGPGRSVSRRSASMRSASSVTSTRPSVRSASRAARIEDRRQRRTDGHSVSARRPVERAQLGARVEAREAIGPCADAGRDQQQPAIGLFRLDRAVHPKREEAAHHVIRTRPFDATHQRPPDWRVRTVARRHGHRRRDRDMPHDDPGSRSVLLDDAGAVGRPLSGAQPHVADPMLDLHVGGVGRSRGDGVVGGREVRDRIAHEPGAHHAERCERTRADDQPRGARVRAGLRSHRPS